MTRPEPSESSLVQAEQRSRKVAPDAWWYLGRMECQFYWDGKMVMVIPTKKIRAALAIMDRQLAQSKLP